MRLKSKYQTYRVTIRPGYTEVINGVPKTVRGIRAVFADHVFDSEKAQREYRWTDQERELVEQTLLECPDFEAGKISPLAETDEDFARYAEVVDDKANATARCIATFDTPEGAEVCGRKVEGDTDYCKEHAAVEAVA